MKIITFIAIGTKNIHSDVLLFSSFSPSPLLALPAAKPPGNQLGVYDYDVGFAENKKFI